MGSELEESSRTICKRISELENGKWKTAVRMVDTDLICPNPYHAPMPISGEELQTLASSILKNGLKTPLTVRAIGTSHRPLFQLISGEKRLRACIYGKITPIPCVIVDADPDRLYEMDEIPLPRNFFEEADIIFELFEKSGVSSLEMAKRLKISEKKLREKLLLHEFDSTERKIVLKAEICAESAALLFSLEPRTKCELYRAMVNGVRRRDAEELIENIAFSRGRTKIYIKDMGFFYNSINKAITTMNKSGIAVKWTKEERKTCTKLIITIPKT